MRQIDFDCRKQIQVGEFTVYVVDDDAHLRAGLAAMLESIGYEVEVFASGSELLDRAATPMTGVVLSDVRLPGLSGLEIQRQFRELGNMCPFIFMTGHGDVPMAVEAMKDGAVGFLSKPCRDQDLIDALTEALVLFQERSERGAKEAEANELLKTLTERECDVLDLLMAGRVGKQIAFDLNISEATVKVHRRNIMKKLKAASLSQLILTYRDLL